jgi:hypothetical protein
MSGQEGQDNQPPPEFMPPPPPSGLKRVASKFDRVIAKTIAKTRLDAEACMNVVSQMVSAKEQAAIQQPSQPRKPEKRVERYRKATPCESQWDEMSGTEKFRLCQQCSLFLYDFKDMDQAQAEELVVQRESKAPVEFFRRKDGKFLIKDCPVAVKKARTNLLTIGIAVASMLIILILSVMNMLSKPVVTVVAPTTSGGAGGSSKQPSSRSTALVSETSSLISRSAMFAPAPGAPVDVIEKDGTVKHFKFGSREYKSELQSATATKL